MTGQSPSQVERPGPRTDFDTFYEWSLPRVYRYAMSATNDAAASEEITSEAFVAMLKSKPAYPDHPYACLAMLRKIALNKSVDWIRHQEVRRKSFGSIAVRSDESHTTPDTLVQAEQRQMIIQALNLLSAEHRDILQYRYFDGLNTKQIAELIGGTETSASSMLYRARVALRKYFSQMHASNAHPNETPDDSGFLVVKGGGTDE